ncbi:MAG: hypothetical protein AAGD13_21915 [Pseudomonadota bacterium]
MTRKLMIRTAIFTLLAAAAFALPAEAWAGIVEQVEAAKGYYTEILAAAGIVVALVAIDTISWPWLTGQD